MSHEAKALRGPGFRSTPYRTDMLLGSLWALEDHLMTDLNASGELLLSSLLGYLNRRESDIIRGTLTLKLQPRGLEYLYSRLQVLEEIDALRQSSPADFFRGAFTDLDDYTRLQKLQHILQHAQSVRVQPAVNHLRVNVSPFQRLKKLELLGCDLSTSAWIGLDQGQSFECLRCIGCLEELHHLLSPYSHLLSPSSGHAESLWPNLTYLQCSRNAFERMDSSLNLPALRVLDLSNNNITAIQNLHLCSRLMTLNLNYNNIESLSPLRECATTLQELKLQGNGVRSLKGLQTLTCLTELDLRCNLLASYPEFNFLKELTGLQQLWLEGNPLSYAPFYRLDVLAWSEGRRLHLDGVLPKSSETAAVALRATGEVPLAWHIMAQFVSQQHLLWRPKKAISPQASAIWRAGSIGQHPRFSPHRSGRRRSLHTKRLPARRIVDFTGDPLAALQSAMERPPSPSPFQPSKDDSTESVSKASSTSGGRLPLLRSQDRMNLATVHTTYRDCSAAPDRSRPLVADSKTPVFSQSVIDDAHEEETDLGIRARSHGSDSESSSLNTTSSQELGESPNGKLSQKSIQKL